MVRSGVVSVASRVVASVGRRGSRVVAGVALPLALLLTIGGVATAGAITPAAGAQVQTFVSSLPDVPPPSQFAGIGPIGLVFDQTDHLLVSDAANQGFYSFGPNGSSAPSPITTGTVQTGLAFAKNGDLFAALYQAGNIDQIDPASGAFIRQLNPAGTNYQCIESVATDPISGDLFFSQPNSGGVCPGSNTITRVENPTSPKPVFITYITLTPASADGIAFGRDGTLYAVVQSGTSGCATRISGTNLPSPPTATTIGCVIGPGIFAGIDAIAVSARSRTQPEVFVSGPDGVIRKIDQSRNPPLVTPVVTLATPVNGLTIGLDGCLYATQSTTIDKIVPADGNCGLVRVTVTPSLRLRPDTINSATVGRAVLLRAKFTNGAGAGQPIKFTVVGANPTTRTVITDRSGRAWFTYRAVHPGNDTVTATTTIGSTGLASNPAVVHWQSPA